MTIPKRVGVLAHPKRDNTRSVAHRIAQSLKHHEIDSWVRTTWREDDVSKAVESSDMVVAIGGDGAMLHTARVCAPYDVPVLGVNMGRLGFLTEIAHPDEWESHLSDLLNGAFWVENRMMLTADIRRQRETIHSGNALNDVVISGAQFGSMIQADTYIDSHWATTYNSDALIISTPTGSTAYALAAGGPILPPDLTNILIVPTAAHLSVDRPIVLSEGSTVAVRLNADNRHETLITLDGTPLAKLASDDILVVRACDYHSRFIRLRERNYFYRSLLDRLEPRVNRTPPQRRLQDI